VFTELALTGYYPGDLLEEPEFLERAARGLECLQDASRALPQLHWIVGAPQAGLTSWFGWLLGMVLWPWLYVFLDMARLRSRERNG